MCELLEACSDVEQKLWEMLNPFWISWLNYTQNRKSGYHYQKLWWQMTCVQWTKSGTNLIKCMVSINLSVTKGLDIMICLPYVVFSAVMSINVWFLPQWLPPSMSLYVNIGKMAHQAATPDCFLPLLWPSQQGHMLQSQNQGINLIKTYSSWFGFVDLSEATCYPDKWKKIKNSQNNIHIQL